MESLIVSDALWRLVSPVIRPRWTGRNTPGRKEVDDRSALSAILFALRSGIGFDQIPKELGFGASSAVFRRLQRWRQDGTWPQIQTVLQNNMADAGRLDWARASVGQSAVKAFCARKPRSRRRAATA